MKYDSGDMVTYYFIINDDGRNSAIQGWTDDKKLAKFYLKFHNCKRFSMKSLTKTIEEISAILDENNNDEIKIINITVRDHKNHNRVKYLSVPMTNTEFMFVNEECKSLMASVVNYAFIESAIPYLKNSYKKDLKMILLIDSIDSNIHGKTSAIIKEMAFDQLMILLQSFPDNFG